MMADLFAHEARLVAFVADFADEDLAQEGVQRLLDAILRITAGVLLPAQRSEEPFQYRETPLRRILLVRRRDEEIRMLDPVAREFSRRLVC
jgi:hypothetical protein